MNMEEKQGRGRKPFQITTDSDFLWAFQYLERKIHKGDIDDVWLPKLRRVKSPEQIQNWCDEYLTEKEWGQLIAARRRQAFRDRNWKPKNKPRKYKSYDLHWRAHSALEEIAKENDLTISQAVLYLQDVYERALKRRVGMPKESDLAEFRRETE